MGKDQIKNSRKKHALGVYNLLIFGLFGMFPIKIEGEFIWTFRKLVVEF